MMIDNLLLSLSCVAPIVVYLIVGFFVRKSGILSDKTIKESNRLVFDFLMPMHLFSIVYSADFGTSFSLQLILYLILLVCLFFVGSVLLLRALGRSRREIGAASQNAFRSNLNIIALPLAESLLGAPGLASMAIISGFLTPIYNIFAVVTLEIHHEDRERRKISVGHIALDILKNPLIIGTLLGFLLKLLPFELPSLVLSPVQTLGKTGTTMALVLLGATFKFSSIRSDSKRILFGNLFRLILAPLIALFIAYVLGFRGDDLALILLATGAPLATTAYTMCEVYDSDADLAAELVVTTSVLCCLTMFLWIFCLKEIGLF